MDPQSDQPNRESQPQKMQHPLDPYDHLRPKQTHEEHGTEKVHITWEASEYVMHHKDPSWFIGLAVVTTAIALLLWFTLEDILAIIVLVLMAFAVAVYAVRKPHTLQYSIGDEGVIIGHRKFAYEEFRSFSVMQDGGLLSILLVPTKRFAPSVSIYFSEQDAEAIVDALSRHLPREDREPDFIDRLTRSLRF